MKVTIEYEYLPQYEHKYWAKAIVLDAYHSSCGSSWAEARERLLARLKKLSEVPPSLPPAEEVEVEVAHVC